MVSCAILKGNRAERTEVVVQNEGWFLSDGTHIEFKIVNGSRPESKRCRVSLVHGTKFEKDSDRCTNNAGRVGHQSSNKC